MSRRLVLTAWDKSYARKGDIGKRLGLNLTLAHNTLGSCDFTLSARNPRVGDLSADGARVTVDYYPNDGVTPIRYSGEVTSIHGEGRGETATRTFTVTDDWNVLNTTLGYPTPTADEAHQTTAAYYTTTGPAETVALNVISANATRIGSGLHLTVPSSSGRGSTVTAMLRMHPEADRLLPLIDQAGIGLRVVQTTSTRAVQVYVPTTYSRTLTEGSGIVQNVSFDVTRATATRAIVGVGGQATARGFYRVTSTTTETALGTVLETFVDARDIDPAATDVVTQATARGNEALTEAATKTSLSLTLVEKGAFRFGTTFQLGDKVNMQTLNGPLITDTVRSVQITESADAGIRVVPQVGERSDVSSAYLEKIIAQLAKSLRNLKRS
jgi:hypothetical protein